MKAITERFLKIEIKAEFKFSEFSISKIAKFKCQ